MKTTVQINGQDKELVWTGEGQQYHPEVDGVSFDGHRLLWSFSYEPETYLKESELSGDQWRKGGSIRYFRNGVQVFEDFCREPTDAPIRILHTLPKLVEFDWDKLVKGAKIWYSNTPALIDHVILSQGCFIVVPDGVARFPEPAWHDEDWEMYEDPTCLKVDIFDHNIWWWRK